MTLEDLIKESQKHHKVNSKRLKDAYDFARRAHSGQTRMSGESYISHPLAVAMIVAEYGADEDSLIAALLHDVVEDTKYGFLDIEKEFGKTVTRMVQALTKLPHTGSFRGPHQHQFDSKIETIRKVFEVMQKDVRVIVIKLCDRLHNMRTLKHFRIDKQRRIAQETHDFYSKIADRLCLSDLKERLYELSLQYLYPESFSLIQEKRKSLESSFESNSQRILKKLRSIPLFSSLCLSDFKLDPPYDKILDRISDSIVFETKVFVRLKNEMECYAALREIHSLWRNIRGSVKDYISIPKSNGYQALETSVLKPDGSVVRFIFQTQLMYDYGRFGVALKCFKKSHAGKKIILPWVENLKRIHKETKNKSWDYLSALENDILKGSITIYTVDNKTLFLPPKSTALDAAFYHLGAKAFRVSEILVDQESVLFSHHLIDGERIHFNLSSRDNVNYRWLKYLQTAYAKSFIYEFLKRSSSSKKESIARSILQDGLNDMNYGYLDEISENKKGNVTKRLDLESWSEVLTSITDGSTDPQVVLDLLFDRELVANKKHDSRILIRRKNGDQSINRIFSHLSESAIPFTHVSTQKYDDFYIDQFDVTWSISQKNSIYAYFREFLSFDITELRPIQRGILPIVYLLGIPVLWSLNTFVSRYIMGAGLSVENATELRFISSAAILYLFATIKKMRSHEEYSWFKFPFLFFFVGIVLTLYTYLIHKSLFYTESINYIIPVSISFILIALLQAFKPILTTLRSSRGMIKICIALLLSFLGLAVLLQQSLTPSQEFGIYISVGVLVLHMTYNHFGNIYQRKYKVKSRGMMLLSLSFLFASLIFLPFIDISNLKEVPANILVVAVVNGIFTGGIAHFFFFETSKYLQHYKLTIAMSVMVAMTFVVGMFIEDSANIYTLVASLLLISSFLLAAYFEYRKQGVYDSVHHLV